MNMPGFTATASLFIDDRSYRAINDPRETDRRIVHPSLFTVGSGSIGWNPGCIFYCEERCAYSLNYWACINNCPNQCSYPIGPRIPIH
jgi:hypothetical protein